MSGKKISPKVMEMMRSALLQYVPQARELGMELVDAGKGECWMRVPYAEKLIGDPRTGVIHGGVLTTLLDNACGAAVQLSLPERQSIATLDLRIDYMKSATPGLDLLAHTQCYKVARSVAFVRGTAYHDDPADPIATCVATFMLAANRATPMTEAMMSDMSQSTGVIE